MDKADSSLRRELAMNNSTSGAVWKWGVWVLGLENHLTRDEPNQRGQVDHGQKGAALAFGNEWCHNKE